MTARRRDKRAAGVAAAFLAEARYRVARALGLQAGIDVARGPEEWAFYLQVGSGWVF